jgi:hypothetical protein
VFFLDFRLFAAYMGRAGFKTAIQLFWENAWYGKGGGERDSGTVGRANVCNQFECVRRDSGGETLEEDRQGIGGE